MIPSTLFFFLKIAEVIQGIVWFHINFWDICSSSAKYEMACLESIQPCNMKNRDIYWRRYKIQEALYVGQWYLSPLQSRHVGTSHSFPNHHQIHCSTCSVILNALATQYTCSYNGTYHPHWPVQWSHHCSCMHIPVHSPWLPCYTDVVQTVLIILTMVGLLPYRYCVFLDDYSGFISWQIILHCMEYDL